MFNRECRCLIDYATHSHRICAILKDFEIKSINKKSFRYYIKQIDSMLPCVCSVIDHRWRQNVVRTKKWHTRRSRVCHWCSYYILTSSVIYYWIRRMATWNLFVLHNNEKLFLFQNISTEHESRPFCPAFVPPLHEKKPFDVIFDLFKMKQFHWLLCVAKNCDWFKFKIQKIQKNLNRALSSSMRLSSNRS